MAVANTTLWAWVVPAWFSESPFDHTWVTDFDNSTAPYASDQEVILAGKNNWFCWGDFHPKGGTPALPNGALGSMTANASVAACLVASNLISKDNPPAQGTIFQYGIDGVCHQLANQVLWATSGAAGGPLTVNGARGYHISTFLFGTYGRQEVDWDAKVAHCAPTTTFASRGAIVQHAMDKNTNDEFAQRARKVLAHPEAADKLQRVLALRRDALRTADSMRMRVSTASMVAPSAAELNAHHNEVLRQAAKILTKDEYVQLFGIEPGVTINLVDPTMVGTNPAQR